MHRLSDTRFSSRTSRSNRNPERVAVEVEDSRAFAQGQRASPLRNGKEVRKASSSVWIETKAIAELRRPRPPARPLDRMQTAAAIDKARPPANSRVHLRIGLRINRRNERRCGCQSTQLEPKGRNKANGEVGAALHG